MFIILILKSSDSIFNIAHRNKLHLKTVKEHVHCDTIDADECCVLIKGNAQDWLYYCMNTLLLVLF